MRRAALKIARNVLAALLALLGVVGLAVPFMPQVAFFIAALMVMDIERKRAFVRWLLSRPLLRKIGGEFLHRKLNGKKRAA